jgi:hypothetical protein
MKRMRWAVHVVRTAKMRNMRNVHKICSGNLKERDSLENLDVEGRTIL